MCDDDDEYYNLWGARVTHNTITLNSMFLEVYPVLHP
jgi:hypothetical protein